MSNYYYLVASLPMLTLDGESQITYSSFLSYCKDCMKASDYKELERATFVPAEGARNPLMKAWDAYIGKVQLMLKEERLKRLGWAEEETSSASEDPALRQRLRRACNAMNPLEGEREILSIYFDFISSVKLNSMFSTEALMVYALEIQIIERLRSFDTDKGRAEFKNLFARIQQQFD